VVDPAGILYSGSALPFDESPPLSKSVDAGATWLSLTLPAAPLAAKPGNAVYAVTWDQAVVYSNSTLYRSTDGGADWTTIQALSNTLIDVVIDPFQPSAIFRIDTSTVQNPGKLFHSIDQGTTWTEVDEGLGLTAGYFISAFAADPGTRGVFYAAVNVVWPPSSSPSKLYRTNDSGASWTLLPNAIPGTVTTLVVDPLSPATLYANIDTGGIGGATGIYKSVDGGNTLRQINSSYARAIVVDPVRQNHVYVAPDADGVEVSADGGLNWMPMNSGLPDQATVYSLAIDQNGEFLHAATGVAVFDYQLASPTCSVDARTLCLNDGRFAVTADFQSTPEGPSLPATAVPLTTDTGYFWFFDPANIELVTKVLNGCATNGQYWFFASGLTNVGVQINVTDTISGASKPYSNAFGTPFPPIQDTAAFPCP
jgi:photosystem II stability/assembly factor-like uncharacterized protein